jgi:hypothetical protein
VSRKTGQIPNKTFREWKVFEGKEIGTGGAICVAMNRTIESFLLSLTVALLLVAAFPESGRSQGSVMTLAMTRTDSLQKKFSEQIFKSNQTKAPAVPQKSIVETKKPSVNVSISPAPIYLEKKPLVEPANLFVRTGKNLRQEIRSGLRADLQVGFGQIFYDKPVALDAHNGTRLQEPGCVFLKAHFRF